MSHLIEHTTNNAKRERMWWLETSQKRYTGKYSPCSAKHGSCFTMVDKIMKTTPIRAVHHSQSNTHSKRKETKKCMIILTL